MAMRCRAVGACCWVFYSSTHVAFTPDPNRSRTAVIADAQWLPDPQAGQGVLVELLAMSPGHL